MKPLPPSFFRRSSVQVAPDLLGCYLVKQENDVLLLGRIVEVEAYLGADDAASHAFRGLTARNRSMFAAGGVAYVYLIYGMHHCLNVVTGEAGDGQAILIRALEPLRGIERMAQRRGGRPITQLCNGPGKLCQAFAIDRRFDGHDLTAGRVLWLAESTAPVTAIRQGSRIGVRGDEQARTRPWRFYLADSPYISRA